MALSSLFLLSIFLLVSIHPGAGTENIISQNFFLKMQFNIFVNFPKNKL